MLTGLAAALIVLGAVMTYRAETVFEDRQPEAASGYVAIPFDEQAAIQRFAQALTYPTVSYDDRSRFDSAAFRAFRDFLQTAYPRVSERAARTLVNDHSVVYHLPGADPSLEPVLFMSHFDVVPVEESTAGQWTHAPFAGVVQDGIVWGRGSVDDKFSVVALMEALELLLATGIHPQRSLYFAFGHDEEVGGMDGAARIAEHFRQLGVRFDFVVDEGGAVTQGMVGSIDRPVAVIGVGEKGYVNLVLTAEGSGGHSSQPPEQTALGILARAIVNIEENPFPARLDYMLPTFDAIGAYAPFGTRLAMANLWLLAPLVERKLLGDKDSAAGIRTTTAATMAAGSPKSNILPTRATVVVNARILPGETVETVAQRVAEVIADARVQVRTEYGVDPTPVSPTRSRGYDILARAIRAMDDEVLVAPYMVRGGTDAKYFYALSPNVYRFLPAYVDAETIKYVHGIDERVPVGDYLRAIRFYCHVLREAVAAG